MRIPSKLRIGGHVIRVDCSKELRNEDYGDFSAKTNVIRISKALTQSQKEVTLIHEILHGLNACFDMTPVGHMLLESLAQQLYQVLKDNRLLR